jgi:2-dehydro-3-deoxygalactonokinase
VIASGMIGSRQGWVEVPYRPCPADAAGLAGHLHSHVTARGRRLCFVPGLTVAGALPDVMRGEETEILGALADQPEGRLFVLPGTHSKWARIEDGRRIASFATYMTGELFAVLKAHSILGRLMEGGGRDDAAFARGAAIGLDGDARHGGLLRRLFSARTLALVGDLAPEATESYLSGLLIGAEVREALAGMGTGPGAAAGAGGGPVTLVGGSELVGRYDRVLALAGVATARAAPDAAARGQFLLAELAGLLD